MITAIIIYLAISGVLVWVSDNRKKLLRILFFPVVLLLAPLFLLLFYIFVSKNDRRLILHTS